MLIVLAAIALARWSEQRTRTRSDAPEAAEHNRAGSDASVARLNRNGQARIRLPVARCAGSLGGDPLGPDLICRGRCVAIKQLHCFPRVFEEVLADKVELGQELVGDGDDIATALFRVEDVQQLARARPQELRLGALRHSFLAAAIWGIGSTPLSAIRPAKTETIAGVAGSSALATPRT